MKRRIRIIFESLGLVFSYLCPRAVLRVLRGIRDSLYTGYLRRHFAYMGRRSLFIYKAANLMGTQYISIADDCVFEANLQLTARQTDAGAPVVSIGRNCLFRYGAHVTAVNKITIGDNLLTGTNILITDNSHGATTPNALRLPPRERPVVSKGAVVIGSNVWLGNNVCIMPGVTIGDGAIIGANAVVTKDVPPYCLAAGNPARIIKQIE